MKKVLLLTVIALFLMAPAAFAKTAISDSDLNALTAQEGVVIVFDNFQINNLSIAKQSFGDGDGFGSGSVCPTGAYIGVDQTMEGVNITISGVMTIDVGFNAGAVAYLISSQALPDPTSTANVLGGIKIGLPSIQIGGGSAGPGLNVTQVIRLSETKDLTSTATVTLGTSYMGGVKLDIVTPGAIYISTHGK
jgi:hypothetical protein